MRSRSSITAALALAAVTIIAVAACGSTVSGSAEVNTAAAETMQVSTLTSIESTQRTGTSTSSTATSESAELTIPTEIPTDLSELSSLLSELPSDVSIPSDLGDLGDLGALNIPGYNPACLTVSLAYASILLATFPALVGGSESYDAGNLQQAISELSGELPPEIAGDVQALNEVAAEANGKTLTEVNQLFESEKFTTATANIEAWTTANCGG